MNTECVSTGASPDRDAPCDINLARRWNLYEPLFVNDSV